MFNYSCRLIVSLSRLCLALLLGSWLSFAVQAQDKPPAKPADNEHSQAGFVIEQFHQRSTFENDGSSVEETQGRLKIQSEAGLKRYGLLSFSYASGTGSLEIGYLRVRKPDGSVIATPPDTAQDMPAAITREAPFYSDLHEKQIAIKGLSVGDTLEYKISRHTTKPVAPGQFWLDYRFTKDELVLDEQLQIRVPVPSTVPAHAAYGRTADQPNWVRCDGGWIILRLLGDEREVQHTEEMRNQ